MYFARAQKKKKKTARSYSASVRLPLQWLPLSLSLAARRIRISPLEIVHNAVVVVPVLVIVSVAVVGLSPQSTTKKNAKKKYIYTEVRNYQCLMRKRLSQELKTRLCLQHNINK